TRVPHPSVFPRRRCDERRYDVCRHPLPRVNSRSGYRVNNGPRKQTMDTLKLKPNRMLVGRLANGDLRGMTFAVAMTDIVSILPNQYASHVVFIKTRLGDTIIAENDDGVVGVLRDMGADYMLPAPVPSTTININSPEMKNDGE